MNEYLSTPGSRITGHVSDYVVNKQIMLYVIT